MGTLRSEKFMQHAMTAHGGSVYLVALAQMRSEADAQDVSQDVFCRLLTDDTAFTSNEHLKAWLLRTTINRCRELHRMPWRRRVESADDVGRELPAPGAGTEDAALAELRTDPVWQALQALPEKLRAVALLHYVEEYTTEEISRIVGSPPATVRTRLHRARKQMREALKSLASDGTGAATHPAKEESYGQAHA